MGSFGGKAIQSDSKHNEVERHFRLNRIVLEDGCEKMKQNGSQILHDPRDKCKSEDATRGSFR